MFASLSVSVQWQTKFYLESRWVTVRWGLEEMFEMSAAGLNQCHMTAVGLSPSFQEQCV